MKHLLGSMWLVGVLCLALTGTASAQNKLTLSGFVKDAGTGEEMIGVTIYVPAIENGTVTNVYGFYSITLPPGTYEVTYNFIGYEPTTQEVTLDFANGNQELNISLKEESTELQTTVVEAEAEANVKSVEMSTNRINVSQIKKLPALFGEPDIIKNVQMMPGVISAGEGTSGFFVRGGAADQNLILIDEAPVYDASHFFGLFSVFNASVLKDSKLYKGGIPSRYGGRLSSILDVRTKDGNNQQFGGEAAIGLLASKLMLEGPLMKDKMSFIVSARRSYADVFIKLFGNEDQRENQVYFYDLNAKLSYKPTNKDRFFVAGYLGRDVLKLGGNADFGWGNTTGTFRWNHLYNERLFSNTTLIYSKFDYALKVDDDAQGFDWRANLQAVTLKQDATYFINPKNTLEFGITGAYRTFSSGEVTPVGDGSIFTEFNMPLQYAVDYAVYAANEWEISPKFSVQYGLRWSFFHAIGPENIRVFDDPNNNVDPRYNEERYDRWETIRAFNNLEPRINARYVVSRTSSIKASYNRMAQYIHLLTNSTVPIPFNTWAPSSLYLEPQLADQVSLGYFRNLKGNEYEFSVEAYYKDMRNVTDFADNASILLNQNVATEFRQGRSESYGLEWYLEKKKGKLTGFISYTLSKTTRTVPGVNLGQPFDANYDRRHSLNVVATYALSPYIDLGGTFTYATGRPITLPGGKYEFDGYVADYYTERNGYRMPDFHKLDLSMTYRPKKNDNRNWKSSWIFSIYNTYNRKNPFTIYTRLREDSDGNPLPNAPKEARMIYLFPILPSFSYNINF